MHEIRTETADLPPMVTVDSEGFTIHWDPNMTERKVWVAMGRAVVLDYSKNMSMSSIWSNHQSSRSVFAAVTVGHGMQELL